MDDNLRDQLIEQIKDLDLKKKLLETKNITLEQALEKARAWETANIQAKDMASGESKPTVVNYVKQPGERRKLICHNCGREGHIKRDRMCPARGGKCAKCHVSGHFAACWAEGEGKNKDDMSNNKSSRGQQKRYIRRKQGSTNQVDENGYSSESSEDGLAFSVTEGVHAVSDDPTVPLGINGIVKDILIDSGSMSNLISLNEYEQLKSQGLNADLSKCDEKLFAYGGKQLPVIGKFEVEISSGDRKVQSTFVVTDKGRCLLGHTTSKQLGVPKVGPSVNLECSNVASTPDIKSQLQDKYPKVFSGIGKLTDYKLKLHVDDSKIPVAQKPKRVPFALREKLTAKIEELVQKDIVERVEGPTSWVSPIVVAPKPSGDIRVCVDMRCANEAIVRERIPMPTVDEVLNSLNSSTVLTFV